ncbi:MAG: protease [Archaeoglobi archaeon]|nr:protease [Archaeoglobi archaeon]MDK2781271.1 protease [Archaeoglobi archaeon]
MKLKGKKVGIFAESYYEDLELWYPLIRLKEEGAEITVIGTGSAEEYTGKHGIPVKVDTTADKVSADDFDALIIPGGWAPDRLRRYESVLKLVKDAYDKGKVIAAICHGPWVMISAKIIKGHTATGVVAIKDDLINAGANYVDQEVVVDGKLITSRTPDDLPAFAREIIRVMSEG